MAESVKVIVRCRPMNTREKDLDCKCVVFMDHAHCTCSIVNPNDGSAPPKAFTFDGVYHVNSTTEQIYNEIAYPLVEGVLEGYNCTVFAYGQTGCGKSFTMQGVTTPPSQRGIIPRAFEHIFEAVSVAEGTKYLVLASYLEIYNEDVRDLLGGDSKKRLDLKEHTDKGVFVQDLSQHPVQNVVECEALMDRGWKNRSTGATLMNADSSRSHSIFSIRLEMLEEGEHIRSGKLNLVDLAGSERQAKTGATGERLKEATKINLSLSALGNVISALVDGKSKHIPYRDSKLTRLLQDSLGGNTKTLMVACLSPADNNYDETLSTLRYANRAKNIQNKPKINEDPKDTMLRQYQEEIQKLRDMLETGPTNNNNTSLTDERLVAHEREKVRMEYEHEMSRLREEYEREQNSKCQLQTDLQALKKHYEEEMARINSQPRSTKVNGHRSIGAKTPSELIVDEALKCDSVKISSAQQEVLLRLQKLQKSMVGGERAGDRELKEKRLRKKKSSEKRLQALAKVLSKMDDEEGVVLQVYDDIQQELRIKTDALRKSRTKVKAMEREIQDLQSEFENERTDYLETIRKQNRQLKLYQQISEKILPTLRKECNYSNLERIKNEALWSDDAQKWKLPELIIPRTKLPPAGMSTSERIPPSQTAPGRLEGGYDYNDWGELCYCNCEDEVDLNGDTLIKSNSSSGKSSCSSYGDNQGSPESSPPPLGEESILQKLQRSEQEDIAGTYFKPKRAEELLNRAREDASKAFSTWKDHTNKHRGGGGNVNGYNNMLNASLSQNGLHTSLNALNLNLNSSMVGTGFLNNSWSNGQNTGGTGLSGSNSTGWIGNGFSISPEQSIRRPAKLEALPLLDKKPNKRRNGRLELNTMDII